MGGNISALDDIPQDWVQFTSETDENEDSIDWTQECSYTLTEFLSCDIVKKNPSLIIKLHYTHTNTGVIPADILDMMGCLRGVKCLMFSNGIPEELLCRLTFLESMEKLCLSTMDDHCISELPPFSNGILTKLKQLDVSNVSPAYVTSLFEDMVTQLSHLETLKMSQTHIPLCVTELINLKHLILSGNRLDSLLCSFEFTYLEYLETLDLSDNLWLESLPEWLPELKNLKTLNVKNTGLSELDYSMASMIYLEKLSLSENNLPVLPPCVVKMINLKELNISAMNLSTLPAIFVRLSNLESLNLSSNRLEVFPECVAQIISLKTLEVQNSCLSGLPNSLAQLSNLEYLNISDNTLNGVPQCVTQLMKLKTLLMAGIHLSNLPDSLVQLKRLETLNLSNNDLETLPECVSRMISLTALNIRETGLNGLSDSLAQLSNLEYLNISDNTLNELPQCVTQLMKLKTLLMSRIQLSELPDSMFQLKCLESLNLSANHCKESPVCLTQLRNLRELNIADSNMVQLPDELGDLIDLKAFDVSDNLNLGILPPSMRFLNKLAYLNCGRCHSLAFPPLNVCMQGPTAMRHYMNDLAGSNAVKAPISLVVLGDAGAGKTSIVKSLQNRSRTLTIRNADRPNDESTKVFSVEKIKLDTIDLMAVDYGGHKVYQQTYQYNVREKSLPFFVVDLAEFARLAETHSSQGATRQLLFDWLSQVYLSVPCLDEPALALTHTDELQTEDIKSCRHVLLQEVQNLKEEIKNDQDLFLERAKEDGKMVGLEQIQIFQRMEPVFSDDAIFEVGKDFQGFSRMAKYIQARVERDLTLIPEIWFDLADYISAQRCSPYLELTNLAEKFPRLWVEGPLRHLNSTGLILWFGDIPALRETIFHRMSVLSNHLECFFDHGSFHLWQKRLKSIKPTAKFFNEEIIRKNLCLLYQEGIVSEPFLRYILEQQQSQIPWNLGMALLKEFKLAFGPFNFHIDAEPSYVIPLLSQTETLPLPDQDLPLSVTIQFKGLPPPSHLYSQISVCALKMNSSSTATWKVHKHGVTIIRDEVHLQTNCCEKLKQIEVDVRAPLKRAEFAWQTMMLVVMASLLQAVTSWPGVMFSVILKCSHCLILGRNEPQEELCHTWTTLSPELREDWQHHGTVDPANLKLPQCDLTCMCGEDRIPAILRHPPAPGSVERHIDEISQLLKSIQMSSTTFTTEPMSLDAFIKTEWVRVIHRLHVQPRLVARLCEELVFGPDEMEQLCGRPSKSLTSDQKAIAFLKLTRNLDQERRNVLRSVLENESEGDDGFAEIISKIEPMNEQALAKCKLVLTTSTQPTGTLADIIRPCWCYLVGHLIVGPVLTAQLHQDGLLKSDDEVERLPIESCHMTHTDKAIELLLMIRKRPLSYTKHLIKAINKEQKEVATSLEREWKRIERRKPLNAANTTRRVVRRKKSPPLRSET